MGSRLGSSIVEGDTVTVILTSEEEGTPSISRETITGLWILNRVRLPVVWFKRTIHSCYRYAA